MSASSADVVVVGAGPAGSATAARLAREGFRVVLIDRSEFPRRKPCGECLNPGAVAALDRLGVLARLRESGAVGIRGWRIHPPRAPSFGGELPRGASGLAIPRERLDAILLEEARRSGAELRLGPRVTDLLREEDQVTGVIAGGESIRARLVVGADGLRSVVVRRLRLLRRQPRLRKLALAAHVEGAEESGGWGRMYLVEHGCVGVASVGGGITNVVVVVDSSQAPQVAGAVEEYFDAAIRLAPPLRGAQRNDAVLATGPFDWPIRSAIVGGAMLVGDAAGYYDPFTGQGIYRALRGAELAVEVAGRALRGGDCSVRRLRPYDDARRRSFGPGERLQRAVEFVLARRALFSCAATILARSPGISNALIAATSDVGIARRSRPTD